MPPKGTALHPYQTGDALARRAQTAATDGISKVGFVSGLPRLSQATTAMTDGCRVMAVLPTVP